ncbi:MAG TPA: sigma-70 family RNA polymerase sigma factor [Terriglobales bacterium]|nr:sigma-70 family RNA polymerase sigma factor [Terriglobales bacterium]
MRAMAGATTLGNFAGALGIPSEEATIVAELKAGSEDAYAWLIDQFQQPIYSLVYRIVSDPADAADTTQEVFLKVFRGMKRFNGSSSLKTWVYRIAVHEASNRKRWWFRHKAREMSIEPETRADGENRPALANQLVDGNHSPLESFVQQELKVMVERELRNIDEPFRTTIVLREIEELSYEEIAEVMETSLGTVKSRITRGREALKKRLESHLSGRHVELGRFRSGAGQKVEVTS